MYIQDTKILNIIKYPNKILRQKALPVEKISEEIFKLVDAMIETMLKNDGIGLATNQIGELLRIFVIDTKPLEETPELMAVINPEVIRQEGAVTEEEGCLSFPELHLQITRPERVCIKAQNLYNEWFVMDAQGVLSRAISHEIDHLNGVLFIDHVSEAEKEKLKKYLNGLTSVEDI